jgi:hypothetical protein
MISLNIAQLAVRAVSIPPENSMTIYLGDFGEAIIFTIVFQNLQAR